MARHIHPKRNPYPPVSLNPMTFLDTSSNRWSDRILFSPKEVSELTGVPLSGIYELCYSGQLQAFKIGSRWRIHREGLYHYLKHQLDTAIII